jgi:hypothetical protein
MLVKNTPIKLTVFQYDNINIDLNLFQLSFEI